jgi:bacterioferritin (cytochrome b1)
MKAKSTFLIPIVLIIFSCSEPASNSAAPDALQPKSVDFLYKRVGDDLVEVLYAELAKNTPALRDLEEKINAIGESRSDSLKSFLDYDSKNESYYKSAAYLTEKVKDSVLKEKISLLINRSEVAYKGSTSAQKGLINQIDSKKMTINDLHILLKISKTLPIIEKYQLQSKPSNRPIKGYIIEMDKVIKLVDTPSRRAL